MNWPEAIVLVCAMICTTIFLAMLFDWAKASKR